MKNLFKKVNKNLLSPDGLSVSAALVAVCLLFSATTLWAEYELLSSTSSSVRMREAQRLGNEFDIESAPYLLELLDDESAGVRINAAVSLGRLGEDGAVAPLIRMLKEDPSPSVRIMAAQVLGGFAGEAVIEALFEAADGDDEFLGSAAVRVLGRGGREEALEKLIDKAESSRIPRIREAALEAIAEILKGELPDAVTLNRISRAAERASRDRNTRVREAAEETLSGIERIRGRREEEEERGLRR